MKNILFICTGNTCRSPMAEVIAKAVIKDMGLDKEYTVSSAGIYAMPRETASFQAVEAMAEIGLDLTGHKARRADPDTIGSAYIIFTMTSAHKDTIASIYSCSEGKVFSLKEYVDGINGDIYDPYGQSVDVYKKCANELKSYILRAVKKLSLGSI